MPDIKDQARGNWTYILTSLGVDSSRLVNRHGPCPFCGGTDRFRFDDKQGSGSYFCNQCGPGSGMDFAMKFIKQNFRETAKVIRSILGHPAHATEHKTLPEAAKELTGADNLSKFKFLWEKGKPIKDSPLALAYLAGRGIDGLAFADVRFLDGAYLGKDKKLPALLAAVRNQFGDLVQIHRTFLSLGNTGYEPFVFERRFMKGSIPQGGAVRLFHAETSQIGIAEGIETAASASALFGLPVWAALNAANLSKWSPPIDVDRVVIFADNDRSGTGQRSAEELRQKLITLGIEVEIQLPEEPDSDWNDVLRQNRGLRG